MKKRLLGAWLLVNLITFLFAQIALAQTPPIPMAVQGTVKIDDHNVPASTTIKAWCGDTLSGQTDSFDAGGNSNYTLAVLGDTIGTPEVEGCVPGETIVFSIGALELVAHETTSWVTGGSQVINLTAESTQPEIKVKKYTNGSDIVDAPGPYILSSEPITFSYVISNTGNVPLTNIELKDDNGTPGTPGDDIVVCQQSSLNPLLAINCELPGFAEEGQYENTATATAFYTYTISASDNSFYFGARTTIDVEKFTNGADADITPGLFIEYGQPITWTYTITNTSNVELTGVQVTDDNGTPGNTGDDITICNYASMVPDQSHTCEYPGGSAVKGQYSNVATVTGNPPPDLVEVSDSDPSHYFGVEAAVSLIKATDGEEADLPPGPLVRLGNTVNWTYQVDNTSNITLTNVNVSDNLVTGISCQQSTLSPGEQMICQASATADHLGQYGNLGLVSAEPPGGLSLITDTNPSHYYGVDPAITIEKYTNGEDADLAPGPFILEGEPITWTFVISNSGNITLTNITVTDPTISGAVICNISSLGINDPPASCEVSGTAEIGQHVNTATAEADVWVDLGTVTDSDSSHYFGSGPGIELQKRTNDQDADSAPGPYILQNDPVTWTYTISNTGNISLTNVVISDDLLGEICTIALVEPFTPPVDCSSAGTAGEGQYSNLGTATSEVWGGLDPISTTDASHYFGAITTINLEKTTNGVDADVGTGPSILVNHPVTWTFTAQNSGNVTLTQVHIVDDFLTVLDCQVEQLGVLEELTCVVQQTAVAGQHSNQATAYGTPPGLPEVSDVDTSHYFGASPNIAIEKYTNGLDADVGTGPFILSNDPVTWTYTVNNTGNVGLTDVLLHDDNGTPGNPGDDWTCPIGDMATGAQDTTCLKTATAGAGQYENVGLVEANYAGTFAITNISDTDLSHYFGAITQIDVEKLTNGEDADVATGPYIVVNDPITWTFRITNTGNVSLTGVTVSDTFLGQIDCQKDVLIPLEGTQCEAFGQATKGQHENTASAQGSPPGGLPQVADDDPSHYFGADPIIWLEKYTNGQDADFATGPYVLLADPITWTYTVSNTGNVDLTGVTITDDNGTPGNPAHDWDCLIGDLAIGALDRSSCIKEGSAIEGQYKNLGIVIGTPPGGLDSVSDDDPSHYFGSRPEVAIKKLTNGIDADSGTGPFILVGDPVTWTFVITNSGNVTLSNILVTDDNGTPDNSGDDIHSVDLGPLEAGAVTVFNHSGDAAQGAYTNVGYVLGKPIFGPDVRANNPSRYYGAQTSLEINTYTNGLDSDTPRGEFIEAGTPITWTYVITNTSNVSLTNVFVIDDLGTPDDSSDDVEVCTYPLLTVGAGRTCYAYGLAKEGQYANQGIVSGTPPADLSLVSATDPSHYRGYIPAPGIDLEKKVNGSMADNLPGLFIEVGDQVTWTFEILNSGNVSLTQVSLIDDQGTPFDTSDDISVCEISELAPFEDVECELNDIAIEGQFGNTAVVSGTFQTTVVSDTDSSYYFGSIPIVEIQKYTNGQDADTVTGPLLTAGDTVTWSYVISNTGNVTLTQLSVQDDLLGLICEFDSMSPGEAPFVCQHTGTVMPGQYANQGTVSATWPSGEMINAEDWSHYYGAFWLYMPLILNN